MDANESDNNSDDSDDEDNHSAESDVDVETVDPPEGEAEGDAEAVEDETSNDVVADGEDHLYPPLQPLAARVAEAFPLDEHANAQESEPAGDTGTGAAPEPQLQPEPEPEPEPKPEPEPEPETEDTGDTAAAGSAEEAEAPTLEPASPHEGVPETRSLESRSSSIKALQERLGKSPVETGSPNIERPQLQAISPGSSLAERMAKLNSVAGSNDSPSGSPVPRPRPTGKPTGSISALQNTLNLSAGMIAGQSPKASPTNERERLQGLQTFKLRNELKQRGLNQQGTKAEMIERLLGASDDEAGGGSDTANEAQKISEAKAEQQQKAAEASKIRREAKVAQKVEEARIARIRMSPDEKAAAGQPETIDERVERQRIEKYEASDEYKLEQKKKAEEKANILLATKDQVSEQDLHEEKQALQDAAEKRLASWISAVTETELPGRLQAELCSGVVLCELANRIKPGSVDSVSDSSMPYPQRENITKFTVFAREIGVLDRENFDTGDLFEGTNMKQVFVCLNALGRRTSEVPGFAGPYLDANDGKTVLGRTSSGKVQALAVNLKDKIGMGPPPPAVGSEEWLEQQKQQGQAGEQLQSPSSKTAPILGTDRGGVLLAEAAPEKAPSAHVTKHRARTRGRPRARGRRPRAKARDTEAEGSLLPDDGTADGDDDDDEAAAIAMLAGLDDEGEDDGEEAEEESAGDAEQADPEDRADPSEDGSTDWLAAGADESDAERVDDEAAPELEPEPEPESEPALEPEPEPEPPANDDSQVDDSAADADDDDTEVGEGGQEDDDDDEAAALAMLAGLDAEGDGDADGSDDDDDGSSDDADSMFGDESSSEDDESSSEEEAQG